jgi:alpha-beta hydrolase superfamily lysophospholipase
MGEATVDAWLRDAAEAVEVGRTIGDRVLLVGTSTGATLALWAANRPELTEDLGALVLLSPNLNPRDRKARLLLWPWGGLLARLLEGPERCFETYNDAHARHWTECYPTSALLPMMALAEHVRTSPLEEIRMPTLVVYVPDDQVVDPRETEEAYRRLGSDPKALFAVEAPGDPERHVPAGAALSPESTEEVLRRIQDFVAGLPG